MKILSFLCLLLACTGYGGWLSGHRSGLDLLLLSLAAPGSPPTVLLSPFLSIWLAGIACLSRDLAASVRQYLQPFANGNPRLAAAMPVARAISFALLAVSLDVVLQDLMAQARAPEEGGTLSPATTWFWLPVGIILNGLLLRFVWFNLSPSQHMAKPHNP